METIIRTLNPILLGCSLLWVANLKAQPLLEQLCNDASGFSMPDSVQQVVLGELAQMDVDFPGGLARDILISCELSDYREPVLTNSTFKSTRT